MPRKLEHFVAYSRMLLLCCIISIFCFFTGCSNNKIIKQHKTPAISKQTHLQQAKQLLSQAIETNEETKAVDYRFNAIEHLIQAKELTHAENLLAVTKPNNSAQEHWQFILQAQLANAQQQPTIALDWLKKIWSPYTLSKELQLKYFNTRSASNLRLNNFLATIDDYIRIDHLLPNTEEKKDNAQTIYNILSRLTPAQLDELTNQKPDHVLSGWLNFVQINKQYDYSQEQMQRALTVWQQRYHNHPANLIISPIVADTEESIASPAAETIPNKIGLLLPLSGPYATSAEVIKNGFLSTYYQHRQFREVATEVKIYDTTKEDNINTVYDTALADQVDFVVGPLVKEDIEKLTKHFNSRVPVLALNNLGSSYDNRTWSNFYQFALSPENEAMAVAEQARKDGHRQALVLVHDNEQGQRIANAFREAWENESLTITAIAKLKEKHDLNETIRKLLGVNFVETHRKDPKTNKHIRHTSGNHRRQDIDMIFLATNPNLSRQIKPLLNYYYANDLPVYATSNVYSGKPNASLDQDLNDIKFCDMPWILDPTIKSRKIYQNIAKLWPNNLAQTPRLFALGIDAYRLTNQIQQLKAAKDFGISGMSGMLTLNKNHKVQRGLIWAVFKKGVPVLITTVQNGTIDSLLDQSQKESSLLNSAVEETPIEIELDDSNYKPSEQDQ